MDDDEDEEEEEKEGGLWTCRALRQCSRTSHAYGGRGRMSERVSPVNEQCLNIFCFLIKQNLKSPLVCKPCGCLPA